MIAIALAVITLGCIVAGVVRWRMTEARAAAIDASLPAVPDLTGRPPVLVEAIARADAAARSRATGLAGVEELARLYHANQFSREAEACWQILRQERPREARWSHYLADLRRTAGDQEAMIPLLESTLDLAPDYAPARLQLANLLLKIGRIDEADSHFRIRLRALPADPYARLGLARVAMQKNQTDEARAQLEALLKDAPHFSTAHNIYAAILTAAGDESGAARHRWLGQETLRYREAEDPWLDELDTWCHDYDRLCARGTLEFLGEKQDAAAAYFGHALRLDPGRPRAYELLAELHLKRGEPDAARSLLEDARSHLTGPPSHHFFATLGQAYRALRQPADAIRVAREGLARLPDEPELHDTLGLALADAGRHEEAVAAWQAGLAKQPGDASINYNLATSLLELRRLDDALAALDRSLARQPTFLPTLLLRGEIELQAGHLDLAERYLRPALESHQEHPQARRLMAAWHLDMGVAAETKGDPAAAERHYRDGLGLAPEHPELLLRLGVSCLVHRRFEQALAPLQTYHALQPGDAQGCLFLGQAYAATRQRDQAREVLRRGAHLAEQAGKDATAARCRKILEQL